MYCSTKSTATRPRSYTTFAHLLFMQSCVAAYTCLSKVQRTLHSFCLLAFLGSRGWVKRGAWYLFKLPQRIRRLCLYVLFEEHGQASVEAAILLPSLLFIIGLMAQPICIFYTRTVMNAAASEAARLVLTQSNQVSKDDIDAFILRRLQAVPPLAIFHEGGDEGWQIALGESDQLIEITLTSKIKPLPLFGVFSIALTGATDGVGTIVVHVAEPLRPRWLSGSYEDWVGQWGN